MMTMVPIAGLVALALLVGYEVKKRNWVSLGLSLGVIGATLFLCAVGYQIQLGYDHDHMTEILRGTVDAIEGGQSEKVVGAYRRFEQRRHDAEVSFWDARNALHKELMEINKRHRVQHPAAGD